jgi:hypothetical protein
VEPTLKQRLAEHLAGHPEIIFAMLYGSAAQRETFRDIDIGIVVDRALVPARHDVDYILTLGMELERTLTRPVPVDVVVLNDAPLPFRYNVRMRGVALLVNDWEAYYTFLERTWDDYLDFEPIAMRYLAELRCTP